MPKTARRTWDEASPVQSRLQSIKTNPCAFSFNEFACKWQTGISSHYPVTKQSTLYREMSLIMETDIVEKN